MKCYLILIISLMEQITIEERIISLRGNQEWPTRFCDPTRYDLFLWGFMKSKVYVNKP